MPRARRLGAGAGFRGWLAAVDVRRHLQRAETRAGCPGWNGSRPTRALVPAFWGGPIVNLKGEVIGMSGHAAKPGGVAGREPLRTSRGPGSSHCRRSRCISGRFGGDIWVSRSSPLRFWPGQPGAPGGVVISSVGAGTPAAAAGLRPGDRIVSANGRRLTCSGSFSPTVEETPIGEELTLLVDRNRPADRSEGATSGAAWRGRNGAACLARASRATGARNPGPGRVRSRVVPARPAPQPAKPPSSSDPTSLEPIPGADQNAAPARLHLGPEG